MGNGSPKFLSVQDVLDIHTATIERHGGAHGIRDIALLESAVAMPQQVFGGELLHTDIPGMAAAYLFHLANNHAFVDGNKRVALGACLVFLAANGVQHEIEPEAVLQIVLGVARGQIDKNGLTEWVRSQLERR